MIVGFLCFIYNTHTHCMAFIYIYMCRSVFRCAFCVPGGISCVWMWRIFFYILSNLPPSPRTHFTFTAILYTGTRIVHFGWWLFSLFEMLSLRRWYDDYAQHACFCIFYLKRRNTDLGSFIVQREQFFCFVFAWAFAQVKKKWWARREREEAEKRTKVYLNSHDWDKHSIYKRTFYLFFIWKILQFVFHLFFIRLSFIVISSCMAVRRLYINLYIYKYLFAHFFSVSYSFCSCCS